MTNKEVSFTGINYQACLYCSKVMQAATRDDYQYACGLRETDGQFARVGGIDHPQSIDIYKGCDQFVPNGLPAHPQVLEVLIKANPKCSTIPSDPNATETSWDFTDKMQRYLPVINNIHYTKIQ